MSDFWSDMLQQQKDSVPAVREDESRRALETLERDYGIMLRPMEPAELERGDFQALPADSLARLSGALQQVPGLVAGQSLQNAYQNTYANAYRLLIPKGSENMSFMKNSRLAGEFGEGVIDLTLVDSGGTIRRKAGVEKINPPDVRAQQIAYLAFSAASLVTNQYFLQRIDKKLGAIQKTTENILQFLESDKQSQLQGRWDYLSNSYAKLDSIMKDQDLRQATLAQVQTIKTNTLGDIQLYQQYAQSSMDSFEVSLSKFFKNKKELSNLMGTVQSRISLYWFANYVYQLAVSLEVMLTHNFDSSYLRNIWADMERRVNTYDEIYQRYLNLYVKGSHHSDYGLKNFLTLDENTQTEMRSAAEKCKKYEDYAHVIKTFQPLRQIQPAQLKEIPQNIDTFDQFYNGPIELAVSGEKVYLKLPEHQGHSDGPDVELRMREKE